MNLLESLDQVFDNFITESLLFEEGEVLPKAIRDEGYELIRQGKWRELQDWVYRHHKQTGMGEPEARRRAFRIVTASKKILQRQRGEAARRGITAAKGVLPRDLLDAKTDQIMRSGDWEGLKSRIIDYFISLGYDENRAELNADRYVPMLRSRYEASTTSK